MNKKDILGMPIWFAVGVVSVCIIGITIGSFFDFQISQSLANKTEIGSFFATYGSYFSYCLYVIAGTCLFVGFKEKGKQYNFLAWLLLIIGYFLAVYYSNSYNGAKVRQLFTYTAGESGIGLSIISYLFWVILYAWIPFVFIKILDRKKPNMLLAVGAVILIAGIVSDNVNLWLKQVGSRPRYKYLITLDDPLSEFRNWWEMIPYFAGSNDNFKSWPSGNMTIAAMMFTLPLITNVLIKKDKKINLIAFIFACSFVVLYGYNRIHMTNHFLSDVCFGVLITYLIHGIISYGIINAFEEYDNDHE